MKKEFKDVSRQPVVIDCRGRNGDELFVKMVPGGQGLETVKGDILLALDAGKSVVLKDLDQVRPGTLGYFGTFAPFAAGETPTYTCYEPTGGVLATYDRAKLGKTFSVEATATDPDLLPNSLTYRLNVESPRSVAVGTLVAQKVSIPPTK